MYDTQTPFLCTTKTLHLKKLTDGISLRADSTSQSHLAFLGANHRFTIFTLYIDCGCLDHGLLEHRIETTSEVVSILIG